MQQIPIVYLNDSFLAEDRACIPISDRGFLFGDGVFTTLKVIEGRIQCLRRHLERLKSHCLTVGIDPPSISLDTLRELIEKNTAEKGVWRLKILITGGKHPEMELPERRQGQLLITIRPYLENKTEYRLTIYPEPILRPSARIKSLAYLDRLYLADYAKKNGYDDILTTDHKGVLLEASFSNICWRVGPDLFSPESSLPFLQGINLQLVMIAAKNLGMSIISSKMSLKDLPGNAQFYICNSLKGIKPVTEVNGKYFERDLDWELQLQQELERLIAEETVI